jgi:hypothetical protein
LCFKWVGHPATGFNGTTNKRVTEAERFAAFTAQQSGIIPKGINISGKNESDR